MIAARDSACSCLVAFLIVACGTACIPQHSDPAPKVQAPEAPHLNRPSDVAATDAGKETKASRPSAGGQEAPKESATKSNGLDTEEMKKLLNPECLALFEQIETLNKTIPTQFRFINRPIENIVRDMEQGMILCKRFNDECPGPMADAFVGQILARLYLSSIAHFQDGLKKQGKSIGEIEALVRGRLEEALELTELALANAKPGTPGYQGRAMRLKLDILSQLGRPEEMEQAAKDLLEAFPEYGDRSTVRFNVGKAYFRIKNYSECVRYIDELTAEHSEEPGLVLSNINLFDCLTGLGDLDRMEELMLIIQSEYPKRLPQLRGRELTQARQWIDTSTFWLGFIKYAQGDVEAAKNYFLESKLHLEKRIGAMRAEGKPADPVLDVFLRYRTNDHVDFLHEFHGKVPETSFDLGDMWATTETLDFEKARGNVILAVFREPGNWRAGSFLQAMDELVKEKKDEGLLGLTVSYLGGKPRDGEKEKLLGEMREDLQKLSISLPAGYDPDFKGQSLFRAVHATVGPSATFLVFNRRGEIAWYLFDPRTMDSALARKVVLRLLAD